MKLSQWAKSKGIGYRAAWNHFKQGLIPGAYKLGTGIIIVPDSDHITGKQEHVVCYARVSSSQNKDNLISQSKRLNDFCAAKGWVVSESIQEIGSGLNDSRKKILKIFSDKKATKIIVEHKDRLTRFGFNYIDSLCKSFDCQIVIINPALNDKEDLVQDFTSIITSFCAKVYGQRRAKRNTEKIIKQLEASDDSLK
jgi:predicted site-specific integrase-resolvase